MHATGWCRWARKGMILPVGLALCLGVFRSPPAARGQERQGVAALPGWQRFVEPALSQGAGVFVFFPAVFAGGRAEEVLDPYGFEVVRTPADEPGREWAEPAGRPFRPSAGRWRFWLQGESAMTPFSLLALVPTSGTKARSTPVFLPLAPAGRVRLDDDAPVPGDAELWFLFVDGPSERYELSRRRPAAEARQGVLMPAGTVLAGAWDPGDERWLALSRPFDVPAEGVVPAPLEQPAEDRSWLLARVDRPVETPEDALAGLELALREGEASWPADLKVTTPWSVYGAWYRLPPGPASLVAGNERFYLDAAPLELEGGAIAHLEAPLRPRPILDVNLVLPALLREGPLTLSVRRLPEGEELASVELGPKAGRHRFSGLVHGLLEVDLETHLGTYREQVDLTQRDEASVLLEPQLIELSGRVLFGGSGHPATLELTTATGDTLRAEANEEGDYQATSLYPLRWVKVTLPGETMEPWSDFFTPAIRYSQERDFRIPDVDVVVRVVDRETRAGIAGARVIVRNEYVEPAPEGEDPGHGTEPGGGHERALNSVHAANAEGVVHLPPPRPGSLEIRAQSPDHRPMDEPLVVEVTDPPRDRELQILLDRFGERVELHLALPDGSPAVGAEVLRLDGLATGGTLFAGSADAEGVVRVPAEPAGGQILLRHAGAASAVVDWERWRREERADWRFSPAAPFPLAVQVLDPSGEVPARGAALAVWLGDRKLTGTALFWLAGAQPRADGNGFWSSDRLPAVPVRVLAWGRQVHAEADRGALDTLATPVPWPWPRRVEVKAVQ